MFATIQEGLRIYKKAVEDHKKMAARFSDIQIGNAPELKPGRETLHGMARVLGLTDSEEREIILSIGLASRECQRIMYGYVVF